MSEDEMLKNILKNAETQRLECFLWDETVKMYGKRGMCEECFSKIYVPIKSNMMSDNPSVSDINKDL